MPVESALLSRRLEDALRLAADRHSGQFRRGGNIPAVTHLVAVAWILERAGFQEDVVIAGLLHDLVEDTETSAEEVRERFGPVVAELVLDCSEVKTDASGQKRPWLDRKRDHLAGLANTTTEARAIILADKLHNLISIRNDLESGKDIWSAFHADRPSVLWYFEAMIDRCERGDPRLEALAAECRAQLTAIKASSESK